VKLYVLPPQLKEMDDCLFQGQSSLHPNDVSGAIYVHQIHDNVPLEVVDCVIMFFSIQLLGIVKLYVPSPQSMAMDD
jgi:hypothetical protein